MSQGAPIWISDGLPAVARREFLSRVPPGAVSRRPLIGGVTVWGGPPPPGATVAVGCPNRLGVYETLPPEERWEEVWWWSDPLCAHRSAYGDAPRVRQIRSPVPLPPPDAMDEAAERCEWAADYLARRFRQIRGLHTPDVPSGRRFPLLVGAPPFPILEGVAEELLAPEGPVDGWPGLLLCEVGWWQSRSRLDALVEAVGRAARGERPEKMGPAERRWPPGSR